MHTHQQRAWVSSSQRCTVEAPSVVRHCSCRQRRGAARLGTVVRYGDEDRYTLGAALKTIQLQEEEDSVKALGVEALRHRLSLLGESTLGINSAPALRKLLAFRLHKAKARAIRFPLRRTRKSSSSTRTSKSYMVVPVDVEDVGITDFLIDTGTTGTLITSGMRDQIGLSPVAGNAVRGLDNLGVTLRQKVALPQLRLGPHPLDIPDGFVTEVRSVEDNDNVGGVLGLRFLSSYEVELDPGRGFLAFHPHGHAAQGVVDTHQCARLACRTTKGGLLAVQVSLNGCEPFPGILDLGATYSTINTAAARAAELSGSLPLSVAKVTNPNGSVSTVVRGGIHICLGTPSPPPPFHCNHLHHHRPSSPSSSPSPSPPSASLQRRRTASPSMSPPRSSAPSNASLQRHRRASPSTSPPRSSATPQAEPRGAGADCQWPVTHDVYCPSHELPPLLVRDVPVLSVLGFKHQPAMVLGQDLVGRGRTIFCLHENTIYLQL